MTMEDKYTVVIPTAGTSSRLGNLTKYLNKSLTSIQNKPVLSRIIEMFPENTDFVIALGYKGELVKQFLECAYPEKKFNFANVEKFEGEGSGLGLTLLQCEKFLKKPFVFCSCDTLAAEKIEFDNENTACFAEIEDIKAYRTLCVNKNNVTKVCDKNEPEKNSKAYIGLAYIKDYELFWNFMHEGKEEAVKLGESYPLIKFAEKGILKAKKFTWTDTGNPESFNKAQNFYKEKDEPNILPKPDEAIWFVNDKVIKFSNNESFIKDRTERSKILTGFVPEIVHSTKNMYVYKKEDGIVLSKIENIETFAKLLNFCKTFWQPKILNEKEKNEFYLTCKKFYEDKTLNRINQYYSTFNTSDKEIEVNGKLLPKTSEILKKIDWKNIFDGLPGRFHGDFHFENILYNKKNEQFIFLDWRQNFGNSLTVGDIYYDLAKLLHGLIICHELIAKNKYAVDLTNERINFSFERKDILIECEKYYYDWLSVNGYDTKKVKILTALIYLNISALHHYPYCHLLYYLGKQMLFENI